MGSPNARVITQNLDGLHFFSADADGQEQGAGDDAAASALHMSSGERHRLLIEVHGNGDGYRCSSAGEVPGEVWGDTWRQPCPTSAHTVLTMSLDVDFDGDGLPQLTTAPTCPICASAALPCALFFDEAYTVHGCFRWNECLQWLSSADVLVLVGTSVSVNVCNFALRAARANNAEVYNFNLEPLSRGGSGCGGSYSVHDIIGPTEVTLPALRAACEHLGD